MTQVLRTPDERFENLPDFPYEPNYVTVNGLRIHYIDEGPKIAGPVLMLHGEPSWCYLYRKMIPAIAAAGHRAIAPDLVGFGRSDKLPRREDYSYQFHVDIVEGFVKALDLKDITLVCQDWGGLLGLRVLAAHPDRFARAVVANTGLPTGEGKPSEGFLQWRKFSQEVDNFHVGGIVNGGCSSDLSEEVIAAYNAPFPDDSYKAAARIFPMLVPISPDDPAAAANKKAWETLTKFTKPVLTAFSDNDPITKGGDKVFQKLVPGAQGQPHTTIANAGHFLQEDQGEELARVVVEFIAATP